MITASRSCCLALRTLCSTPCFSSRRESRSDFSMLVVPTSTGCPAWWRSTMSSTTALNLAASVWYTRSASSRRIIGWLVGMGTTSSL